MGHQILVADDTLNVQRHIKDVLEPAGFSVSFADNGEEAIKLALQLSPDLILADVQMPKLGGIDVCTRLKRLPHFAGVPVLFLVGPFDEYDETLARRAGGSGILHKPISPAALLSAVRSSLAPAAPAPSSVLTIEEEDEADRLERLSELPEPETVSPLLVTAVDPWQPAHDGDFETRSPSRPREAPWASSHSSLPVHPEDDHAGEVMLSVEDVAEVQIDDSEEEAAARARVPGTLRDDAPPLLATRPAAPISQERMEQLVRDEIRAILPQILRETVDRVVRERIAQLEQRMRGLERGELMPDEVRAQVR